MVIQEFKSITEEMKYKRAQARNAICIWNLSRIWINKENLIF